MVAREPLSRPSNWTTSLAHDPLTSPTWCLVPDDFETAKNWACSACGHRFTEPPLANDSPIGRLLEEISWEGNARTYRQGGRGRENVLTTEVFTLLDLLPRGAFLGAVLGAAHGADQHRTQANAQAEELKFSVLPGDVAAIRADGITSPWTVQPDVRLETADVAVWVEAKRIRPSSFQQHQIARTLQALVTATNQPNRLLVLLLAAPPPVKVARVGALSIPEAVSHSHSLPGMGGPADQQLVAGAVEQVAWLTWSELGRAVRQAAKSWRNPDTSTAAAVTRMATELNRAIAWHS